MKMMKNLISILMVVVACCCFLVAGAAALVDATEEMATGSAVLPQQKIGIVGGGAAGITAAYLLNKKGYDITVLEKDDRVGGFARTEIVDGKPFDMSVLYVPGGSVTGAGVEPTLQEMIDVSEATLSPAIDHFSLESDSQMLDVIPETIQGIETDVIIDQLLTGLQYSTQLYQCLADPTTCESCGELCRDADMLLTEWGEKWGVPVYANVSILVIDGLGVQPASFVVTFEYTLSDFISSYVGELLAMLGVTEETLPEDTPANIRSLIFDQEGWYVFDDGYQTFFEQLIDKAGLWVETGFEVSSMVRRMSSGPSSDVVESRDAMTPIISDNSWYVTSRGGTELAFDQVIVTTAPQDAIPFVPEDRSMLLQTGVPLLPRITDVFLTRGTDSNAEDTDVDNEISSFWPTGFGLGTASIVDPTFGGPVKSFFYQNRYKLDDVWGIGTVTLSQETPAEDAYMAVIGFSRDVLGLDLSDDYMYHERFVWPSGPLDRPKWESDWSLLQGADGLWFSGEAFSGTGVCRITQYSRALFEENFPDVATTNESVAARIERHLLLSFVASTLLPGLACM